MKPDQIEMMCKNLSLQADTLVVSCGIRRGITYFYSEDSSKSEIAALRMFYENRKLKDNPRVLYSENLKTWVFALGTTLA